MASLGDRMKKAEVDSLLVSEIKPWEPFLVRLDGKNFSTFTRGFIKPFDRNFYTAMVNTMIDATTKFQAATGYTHSDEITLIFQPLVSSEEEWNKIPSDRRPTRAYSGRVFKLLTLLSGYVSTRFNVHIAKEVSTQTYGVYEEHFVDKVNSFEQMFDARLVMFPDNPIDFVNHMIWRQRDCYRNAFSQIGRNWFSNKELHKKSTPEVIEMLSSKGDYDAEMWKIFTEGVYCKFVKYTATVEYKGEEIVTERTHVMNIQTHPTAATIDWFDFLMAKRLDSFAEMEKMKD